CGRWKIHRGGARRLKPALEIFYRSAEALRHPKCQKPRHTHQHPETTQTLTPKKPRKTSQNTLSGGKSCQYVETTRRGLSPCSRRLYSLALHDPFTPLKMLCWIYRD